MIEESVDDVDGGILNRRPSLGENNVGMKTMTDEEGTEWLDILGSGQIKKRVLKKGPKEQRPDRTDRCLVSYNGYLDDGTLVETEKNKEIQLGDFEILFGVELSLALMDIGEEAEVLIHSRFAYGTRGLPPNIPPNASMKYTVVLHSVTPATPIQDMTLDSRLELGNRLKTRGNWWYAREEYTFAIQCYRRALEFLDPSEINIPFSPSERDALVDNQLKTYNNLAAAQLKVKALDGALISLSHVLNHQPDNIKALFRKARILKEQGNLDESLNAIRKALEVEPDSSLLHQELSKLQTLLKQDISNQKMLYKKMLGREANDDKIEGNKVNKDKAFQGFPSWRWLALIGLAAVLVGAFAVKYKY